MPKLNFTKIIWVLYYTFIFFYLLNHFFQYLDTDFGWHLKVGEEISRSGEVPHIEHFDFSLEGQRWVDHEWLSNLFVYFIYDNFGYIGLNVFFVLIILVSLIILNKFTQKCFLKYDQRGIFFIIAFQILGVVAMRPHLGVRIQEITVLNLLILVIIIHYYNRHKKPKILFFLPFLFYFWACVHAGFLIGFFVMFLWACFKSIEILIQKKEFSYVNLRMPIIFSIFAFLSFLATLITPYGLELYSFLSSYSSTYYLTHISEWLPFFYYPILYWQLLYSAFVICAIILMFICKKSLFVKYSKWYLFLTIIFFLLSLKSRRHFPLFFIVSFPILVQFFVNFFAGTTLPKKFLQNIKDSFIIKFCFIACFLLVIVSQFIIIYPIKDPFSKLKNGYPAASVEFIKSYPEYLGKRTFSRYCWGGYLIWALPENKLFIDGRLPQYAFRGHTMLQEYNEFFQKGQARRKLNEHDIELVLLSLEQVQVKLNWFEKYILNFKEEGMNDRENYLEDYLDSASEWNMVYENKVSKVYVKEGD